MVRHIVTKVGVKTNEIMCVLVINGKEIPKEKELLTEVTKKFPEVKTIVKNINTQNTNVVMGKENIVIYGSGYIKDQLGKYIFKISPHSFYQVNPIQAENLYNIGVQAANISKNDIVFDLYCGIGTISLFMAQYAKKVYGIEIVEQAIQDAKENAKINNIEITDEMKSLAENMTKASGRSELKMYKNGFDLWLNSFQTSLVAVGGSAALGFLVGLIPGIGASLAGTLLAAILPVISGEYCPNGIFVSYRFNQYLRVRPQ